MTKPQPQPRPTHARALKTFQSRYGLLRKGMVFQPAPGYGNQLERNKLIEWITDEEAARVAAATTPPQQPAGPGEKRQDKSIPGAPNRKDQPGKGEPGQTAPGSEASDSVATPDAGREPSSSASDQAQASPAKTLTTSTAGAVTTPQKKKSLRRKVVLGKSRPDA